MKKKKVVVAMSGGVDSSVAAALLKQQGYEVIGIMLRIWSEKKVINKCCSSQAMSDARQISGLLRIPFYILDYQSIFKETIVDYFINASIQGLTPNPCLFCNQKIRFSQLMQEALNLGADFLATGHYAKTQKVGDEFQLLRAKDKTKDQSYMLHRLNQQQLSRSFFPLGDLKKDEVRTIAKQINLPVSQKKDSQDLCFLGADGVKGFLSRQTKNELKEGDIIDSKGQKLGTHKGLMLYTKGQRKGLGIAATKPLFVIKKDYQNNRLIVGFENERNSKKFYTQQSHFISGKIPQEPTKVKVQIRYHGLETPALITTSKNKKIKVELRQAIADISPGQGAVFYTGEQVLGGGIIAKD